MEQANAAVEHQFGAQTAFSVGYVYSHGLRLLGNSNGVTRQANGNFGFDMNLVPPRLQQLSSGGSCNTATVTLPNGKTYTTPDYSAIDGFINPNFGTINAVDNSGLSIYNGLLISLRHHSQQFVTSVAYTLSQQSIKARDISTSSTKRRSADLPSSIRHTGSWLPGYGLRSSTH